MSEQVKIDLSIGASGDATYKLQALDKVVNTIEGSYSKLTKVVEDANEQIDKLNQGIDRSSSKASAFSRDLDKRASQQSSRNPFRFGSGGGASGGDDDDEPGRFGRFRQSRFGKSMMGKSNETGLGRMMGGGNAGAGNAAAGAAAVIGVYLALTEVLGKVGDAMNIVQNSSMTAAQQIEKLAEEFVPGTQNLKKFREALDGTTETLRKNKISYELKDLRQGLFERYKSTQREGQREINAANAVVAGMTRGPKFDKYLGGSIDRSTVGGELAYGEYKQRFAARNEEVKARQEQFAAQQERNAQRNRVSDAERELNAAKTKRDADQKRVDELRKYENTFGKRRKGEMDTALNDLALSQKNVTQRELALEEEKTKNKEKQLSLAQADYNLRQKMIESEKTELGILEQKEQRMSQGQRRLGSMGVGEYELAKSALQHLQEFGVEGSSPEIRNLARGIAPEHVGKLEEKFGGGRAKELAALGVGDYERDYRGGETLESVRGKIDAKVEQINLMVQLNERTMAEEVVKILGPALQDLLKSISATVEAQVRERQIGQMKQAQSQ